MEKKGLGHIEILLSFLIFSGFVIFALYFFNPFKTDRIIDNSLDYAMREIIKNTTVEFEKYNIKINDFGASNAIMKIEIGVDNKKVKAENSDGVSVLVEREGSSHNFRFNTTDTRLPSDPNKGFVIFKFSEDFEEEGPGSCAGGCQDLDDDKYSIMSDKMKVISENRIKILNKTYNEDYFTLKQRFNIPSRANFEFTLRFDEYNFISAERYEPRTETFSDVKRVEVLTKEGGIKFADLIVKVW